MTVVASECGSSAGSNGSGTFQLEEQAQPDSTTDAFRIYFFKVASCPKTINHDWTVCPFAHAGEKVRRRCPRLFRYSAVICSEMQLTGRCPCGDFCPAAHTVFELWLHPEKYKTSLCKDGPSCERKVCFFAHLLSDIRVPEQSPPAWLPPPEPLPPGYSITAVQCGGGASNAAKSSIEAAGGSNRGTPAGAGGASSSGSGSAAGAARSSSMGHLPLLGGSSAFQHCSLPPQQQQQQQQLVAPETSTPGAGQVLPLGMSLQQMEAAGPAAAGGLLVSSGLPCYSVVPVSPADVAGGSFSWAAAATTACGLMLPAAGGDCLAPLLPDNQQLLIYQPGLPAAAPGGMCEVSDLMSGLVLRPAGSSSPQPPGVQLAGHNLVAALAVTSNMVQAPMQLVQLQPSHTAMSYGSCGQALPMPGMVVAAPQAATYHQALIHRAASGPAEVAAVQSGVATAAWPAENWPAFQHFQWQQ